MLQTATPEVITNLKNHYKDVPLFLITSNASSKNKFDIVYTCLTDRSYQKLMKMLAEREHLSEEDRMQELYDRVWDECVVWPKLSMEERQSLLVGVPKTVYAAVLEASGFQGVDLQGRYIGPITSLQKIKGYQVWDRITPEELEVLKSRNKTAMYNLTIGQWTFVVRPMLTSDMALVNQFASTQDINQTLVKSLTLWPTGIVWDELPAGIIMAVGNQIQSISVADTSDVEITEL